jgi:hypothetical protein
MGKRQCGVMEEFKRVKHLNSQYDYQQELTQHQGMVDDTTKTVCNQEYHGP